MALTTDPVTTEAATTKDATFVAPGRAGSVVQVKARYENFIGGAWVPRLKSKQNLARNVIHPITPGAIARRPACPETSFSSKKHFHVAFTSSLTVFPNQMKRFIERRMMTANGLGSV